MSTPTKSQFEFWSRTTTNPMLTEKQLFHIGEIVVIWGEIEAEIQLLIWEYMKVTQEVGLAVTAGLTLEAKKNLLLDVLAQNGGSHHLVDRLKAAMVQLDRLKQIRNNIVHGLWIAAAPIQFKKLKNPRYVPEEVDLEGFAYSSGMLANVLNKTRADLLFPKDVPEPDWGAGDAGGDHL